MQEISAKILRYRITHSNIYVSPNLPKTFEVSMEGKANLKTSEDKEDKRVLLNVGLDIRKGEELKIEFVADFIFELGPVLENYDEITEKLIKAKADLGNNTQMIDTLKVREALKDPVTKIVEEIKTVLGLTPPELASDIVERGIVMTGGGSMLRELPRLISKETGVPVILVEKPLECVALGAGEAFGLFKNMSSERSIYNSLND